ncbi:MAG: hypothetical protein Q8R81_00030 [Novosphingobium sp.]|uniref:hypothetical protein n=1 Tax=Novosphingobium sp. TaxID=1874826 RepID=UPI00273495D0|nr:hypothetical protein [Novosphingobium sp.]MDP3548760.1 hypothetical protein [Novosphingobium sp.]
MAGLPTAALQLAGFLMAHAFWATSELPAGSTYQPQSLCMRGDGSRSLQSFEGATPKAQDDAARAFITGGAAQWPDCAIARAVKVGTPTGDVDALVIDVVQNGGNVMTVVQAFRPATQGFRLLGDELVMGDGGPLPPLPAAQAAAAMRVGAIDHPGLGDKWQQWEMARDRISPLVQR